MDITKIDKNFIVDSKIDDGNFEWLSIDDPRIKLYGAYSTSPIVRMPVEVANVISEGVKGLNYHTAGIRFHIRTDSKRIALNVKWNILIALYNHKISSLISMLRKFYQSAIFYHRLTPFIYIF